MAGVIRATTDPELADRAARHGALSDPLRLAIVDELGRSDRSPGELRALLDVPSNLLAHHLDALERVGLVVRTTSSGDARRRYVRLVPAALPAASVQPPPSDHGARADDVLFVCTHNSARSQLAAALWRSRTGAAASSAGTHPADRIHPGAVAAADRAGLALEGATPRQLQPDEHTPPLVVTVCDQAHEELRPPSDWLHWSVPDPVRVGTDAAFDATVAELRQRISRLTPADGDGA